MHNRILCFGEISWDRLWVLDEFPRPDQDCHLLFEQEGPGGCALNTACVLAGMGLPVTLGGNALGQDKRGEPIRQYLARLGVEALLVLRAGIATPFCQCLVEQGSGSRRFIVE